MGRIFLVFLIFLLSTKNAFADAEATCTQNMNIGTYIQTGTTASCTLNYSGAVSSLSNISSTTSSVPAAGIVKIYNGNASSNSKISISTPSDVTLSGASGCTIKIKNFTLSTTSQSLAKGASMDVKIGGTAAISDGFCEAGTYNGNITLDFTYTVRFIVDFTRSSSITIPVSISLETPLSIEETQDMSFGIFLQPSQSSTITINPNGTSSHSSGITFVNSNLRPGKFLVSGVAGRSVQIQLPSSTTLTSSSSSMVVDTFKSDVTSPFLLDGSGANGSKTISVGSTLHVNTNQTAGQYQGTYNVYVNY